MVVFIRKPSFDCILRNNILRCWLGVVLTSAWLNLGTHTRRGGGARLRLQYLDRISYFAAVCEGEVAWCQSRRERCLGWREYFCVKKVVFKKRGSDRTPISILLFFIFAGFLDRRYAVGEGGGGWSLAVGYRRGLSLDGNTLLL